MKSGGMSYSRGSLYSLLQNRIYLGKIQHRDATYAGEHDAIIPQELWDKVQDRLRDNNKVRRNGRNAKSPSLLVGLLYDDQGNRFTPSHAVKRGKRYRYYVSQAAIHHRATAKTGPTRIPAAGNRGGCLPQTAVASKFTRTTAPGNWRGVRGAATSKLLISRREATSESMAGQIANRTTGIFERRDRANCCPRAQSGGQR